MSSIKSFDRPTLKMIRSELDAALATIAVKHGFGLKVGSIRFTETAFTVKVEATLSGESPEALRYREAALMVGLDPKLLGKSVHFRGEVFKVVGLKAGYRSILVERGDKVYRISTDRFRTGARPVA